MLPNTNNSKYKDMENFKVIYEGTALDNGSMDAKELVPALWALSDLIEETNRLLYNNEKKIALKINAFERSSFAIELSLLEMWDTIVSLFKQDGVSTIVDILSVLGLTVSGTGTGLFALIKWLKARKIKTIEGVGHTTDVTIKLENGEEIITTKNVITLLESPKIRDAVYKMTKPLEQEGIDTLHIGESKEQSLIITSEDIEYFKPPTQYDNKVNEYSRKMNLKLLSLAFKEGNKWKVTDGTTEFFAMVSDAKFINDIENDRISFSKNGTLVVDMTTRQFESTKGLKTEHEITRVIEYRPPSQLKLML